MKKFILSLLALVMSIITNAAIVNLGTEVEGTNVNVYWQSDSVSVYYDVALVSPVTYTYFCDGAWPAYAFADSLWMSITTDILLTYGINYTNLDPEMLDSIIPIWKEGWEASVDTIENALTLKPGVYMVTITGLDSTFQVSEKEIYAIFEISEAQAIEFVPINNKAVKMVDVNTNRVYIIRDDNVYDVYGRKIKNKQ